MYNHHLHDFDADEDGGDDDGDLAEEEDKVSHGVDGGHAEHVRVDVLVGLLRARAEVVAVDGWKPVKTGFGI